jgi:hypothetical protein
MIVRGGLTEILTSLRSDNLLLNLPTRDLIASVYVTIICII